MGQEKHCATRLTALHLHIIGIQCSGVDATGSCALVLLNERHSAWQQLHNAIVQLSRVNRKKRHIAVICSLVDYQPHLFQKFVALHHSQLGNETEFAFATLFTALLVCNCDNGQL